MKVKVGNSSETVQRVKVHSNNNCNI